MPSTTTRERAGLGRLVQMLGLVLVAAAATLSQPAYAEPGELRELARQFQSLSSLGFWAELQMDFSLKGLNEMTDQPAEPDPVDAAPPIPVFGHLEYWASGDQYWIDSQVDPDRLPGLQTTTAFDGQRFQLLIGSTGLLLTRLNDPQTIVPTVENPLLALLQFRYPLTDDNAHHQLGLEDIQEDVIPDSFWTVEWVPVNDNGRELERAVFPGGVWEQRAYTFNVLALPGARNRPVRIDRVALDGRVYTTMQFLDYQRADTAGGSAWWPQQVIMQAFDEQGNFFGKTTYWLVALNIDSPLAPEFFRIPVECADFVWDDDQRQFASSHLAPPVP